VFPVRYELNFYIKFTRNLVFKRLIRFSEFNEIRKNNDFNFAKVSNNREITSQCNPYTQILSIVTAEFLSGNETSWV
jgi:hypothetical protein